MFSVVRDVHKENFTVISNKVLMDERLSLAARGFFSIILSLPDDWDFSVRGMASICGISVDRAAKCTKELQQHGYLIRERTKEGGRFNDFDYCFYEVLCTEKPDTENPDTEKPDTEKPDMEKPDTEKPDTEKPDTEKPDTENPDTENPDTENPDMEKPDMEKPDMEKPDMENSAQLNTNIQNTNKPNTKETNTNGPITQQPNSPQAETDGVQFITSGERRELFRKNIGADILASLYGERFAEDALRAMELLASGVGRYVNGERVEGEELKKYMLLVRQEDVRMAEELVSGKELKNYIAYFGSVLFNIVRERVYREERERQRSERAAVPLFRQQTQDDAPPDDGTYQNADVQAFMEKVMRRYLE